MGMAAQEVAPIPSNCTQSVTARWKKCNALADQLWQRFTVEIRPHYGALNRWIRKKPNLAVGDLVLYLESKQRGKWPIARITSIHESSADGIVRSVITTYKGREYRRSAHSLLLLNAMNIWKSAPEENESQ